MQRLQTDLEAALMADWCASDLVDLLLQRQELEVGVFVIQHPAALTIALNSRSLSSTLIVGIACSPLLSLHHLTLSCRVN
jgi:hypothetical protein